jgi:uncharacterized membrane protein YtjA (UPF0391 family)
MMGMFFWWAAVILIILGLVAYILGAKGIAGITLGMARWFFIFFIVLAIISLIFGIL